MATLDEIRTVERLMQTLDDNPPLLEALRSRVLTRELLELPANHAKLTARVDQIGEALTQLIARVDQLTADMIQRFDRVTNDLTRLKNTGTMTATHDQASLIPREFGLRYLRVVSRLELGDLVDSWDTTGIRTGDLRSFRRADLVMEAADRGGELHYIAVEASFTADSRDTRRAVRNAAYLTRFTGRPAKAAVAAHRIDWEIQPILDSGQVVWFQLEEDDAD